MDDSMKWLIGLSVTILGLLVTAMITAFNNLSKKQSAGDAALHKRVDEVQRDYVRRDDFREFKENVTKSLDRIEEKQDKIFNIVRPH